MNQQPEAFDLRQTASTLAEQYRTRFQEQRDYRNEVWQILCAEYFQRYVSSAAAVLDLGCGYGQFINNIRASEKYAMDLNPDSRAQVSDDVTFFEQDCSQRWPLESASLDVIFTSNFLEHLPNKATIFDSLKEARRCIAANGVIICLGPNIRYVSGAYWDFWDHQTSLSDRSLSEGLALCGFKTAEIIPRFLPYTMTGGKPVSNFLVRAYLRIPIAWRMLGKQFLIIARAA